MCVLAYLILSLFVPFWISSLFFACRSRRHGVALIEYGANSITHTKPLISLLTSDVTSVPTTPLEVNWEDERNEEMNNTEKETEREREKRNKLPEIQFPLLIVAESGRLTGTGSRPSSRLAGHGCFKRSILISSSSLHHLKLFCFCFPLNG